MSNSFGLAFCRSCGSDYDVGIRHTDAGNQAVCTECGAAGPMAANTALCTQAWNSLYRPEWGNKPGAVHNIRKCSCGNSDTGLIADKGKKQISCDACGSKGPFSDDVETAVDRWNVLQADEPQQVDISHSRSIFELDDLTIAFSHVRTTLRNNDNDLLVFYGADKAAYQTLRGEDADRFMVEYRAWGLS